MRELTQPARRKMPIDLVDFFKHLPRLEVEIIRIEVTAIGDPIFAI